ncbi:MAG: aspartyl protease [Prevotella sp.]|nr:aspartyl protease [Prevotella sp.]
MITRCGFKAFLTHVTPPFREGLGVGSLPSLWGRGWGWGLLFSLPFWGGLGWGFPLSAQQLHRYNPNFGLSAEHFCDTISIDVEDDLILVPVQIDDKVYRFCLDTGSSQGMVYANSNIPDLVPLGNIISRDANNHVDTVQVIQLPPFTLPTNSSQLTISGYVASLMPRHSISDKYDAIIGFDLFNRGICAKIDKQRGLLILTDEKKLFRAEEKVGYTLRYKLKWFVPYLYVSPFVRHTDEALFDTGAPLFYTMSRESFDEHLASDLANLHKNLGSGIERQVEGRAEGHLTLGGFGLEKKDEVVFLHLDRLKWGDFAFTDLHTITTQGASKIGAKLLDFGSVIINPFRKHITFQPYPAAVPSSGEEGLGVVANPSFATEGKGLGVVAKPSPSGELEGGSSSLPTGEGQGGAPSSVRVGNKQFSVAFVPYKGQAVVGLIWEGSPPYKAGMRQGDVILQIDQRPITSFADFQRFGFIKGERHRFRLRDEQGIEKIVECIIKE